jgi:hypothetical protein
MSVRLSIVKDIQYSKPVPYISISGQWLHDAGFAIGKKFVIEVTEKGEIVLKAVEEEEV